MAEGVVRAVSEPCKDAEGQRVAVTETVEDSVPVTEVESVPVTVPHWEGEGVALEHTLPDTVRVRVGDTEAQRVGVEETE